MTSAETFQYSQRIQDSGFRIQDFEKGVLAPHAHIAKTLQQNLLRLGQTALRPINLPIEQGIQGDPQHCTQAQQGVEAGVFTAIFPCGNRRLGDMNLEAQLFLSRPTIRRALRKASAKLLNHTPPKQ